MTKTYRDPQSLPLVQVLQEDTPSLNELAFMKALFSQRDMTLTRAYMQTFPKCMASTAAVNGSRMFTRVLRRGWIQIAFDEAGLTAALTVQTVKDMLLAESIIPIRHSDGVLDFIGTPNWEARRFAIRMLARMHGMLIQEEEQATRKASFAERIQEQWEQRNRLLVEGDGDVSGNGR